MLKAKEDNTGDTLSRKSLVVLSAPTLRDCTQLSRELLKCAPYPQQTSNGPLYSPQNPAKIVVQTSTFLGSNHKK